MSDKNKKKYYTREPIEEYLKRIQISGEGGRSDEGIELGGRVGYKQPINKAPDINVGDKNKHYTREQLEEYLKDFKLAERVAKVMKALSLEEELVINIH